tara:strand:+ start:1201 stop:2037 length:837 start_codon:yes stop_codon:yes gene_type:complete
MSFAVVGAVSAGLSLAGGISNIVGGAKEKKKAKAEAAAAQAELDAQKKALENLDTSNPYKNMENVYEDLTVNQEEAQFIREQQEQQRANILQDLRGAAGGSGIAALAQTLANQGSQDARKAAISIGKQEQQNQMKERAEAGRLQDKFREGEIKSRKMQSEKIDALMGLASADLQAAKKREADAKKQMSEGISQSVGAVADFAMPGGIGSQLGLGGGGGAPDLGNLTMSGGFEGGLPEGMAFSYANEQFMPGGGTGLYTADPNDPNTFFTGPPTITGTF